MNSSTNTNSSITTKYVRDLEKKYESLKKENTNLKKDKNEWQNYGQKFINRFKLFNSLRLFFTKYIDSCTIQLYGSMVRKFFEAHAALAKMDISIGNISGSDMDIALFNYDNIVFNLSKWIIKIQQFFNKLERHLMLYIVAKKKLLIGDFELVKLDDITLNNVSSISPIGRKMLVNIPHYVLTFKNIEDDTYFEVDVMGWKPTDEMWGSDFDVNDIVLSENKFYSTNSIPQIINSIHSGKPNLTIDFEFFQKRAFENGSLWEKKIENLSSIIFFLNVRVKKIIEAGYSINFMSSYNIPCFYIEEKNNCIITDEEPPYISVVLECNHTLSLNAYASIITTKKTDTQATLCPYCRSNIMIKFSEGKLSLFKNIPDLSENLINNMTDMINYKNIESKKKKINFESESRINKLLLEAYKEAEDEEKNYEYELSYSSVPRRARYEREDGSS